MNRDDVIAWCFVFGFLFGVIGIGLALNIYLPVLLAVVTMADWMRFCIIMSSIFIGIAFRLKRKPGA